MNTSNRDPPDDQTKAASDPYTACARNAP